jgi:RNA polymerase sigma-70 factor (ECF subfamily)
MDKDSDEDLMARVGEGSEPAFRVLARRHLPRALGFARRVTGNSADAEEIAQEALLRVWTHAPRWRPVAAFRTWFYRVVLNLCLNRKRRSPFLPLDHGCPNGSAPPSCSAIARASAMRRPQRSSVHRCRASRPCWYARSGRCARSSARSPEDIMS